jgi:hypothetical protein
MGLPLVGNVSSLPWSKYVTQEGQGVNRVTKNLSNIGLKLDATLDKHRQENYQDVHLEFIKCFYLPTKNTLQL